jgi:hypothetical protein
VRGQREAGGIDGLLYESAVEHAEAGATCQAQRIRGLDCHHPMTLRGKACSINTSPSAHVQDCRRHRRHEVHYGFVLHREGESLEALDQFFGMPA